MHTKSFRILLSEDEMMERFHSFPADLHVMLHYEHRHNCVAAIEEIRQFCRLQKAYTFMLNAFPFDEKKLEAYEQPAYMGCAMVWSPRFQQEWAGAFAMGFKWDKNLPHKVSAEVFESNESLYLQLRKHFLK